MNEQQQAGEVPAWALLKAYNLTYHNDPRDMCRTDDDKIADMRGLFVGNAFARYIAAHEPAPVDPLREVVGAAYEASSEEIGPNTALYGRIGNPEKLLAELRARLPGIDDLARAASEGEG